MQDVVATTTDRQLLYWRYNPQAAQRVLPGQDNWVEALACTEPPVSALFM